MRVLTHHAQMIQALSLGSPILGLDVRSLARKQNAARLFPLLGAYNKLLSLLCRLPESVVPAALRLPFFPEPHRHIALPKLCPHPHVNIIVPLDQGYHKGIFGTGSAGNGSGKRAAHRAVRWLGRAAVGVCGLIPHSDSAPSHAPPPPTHVLPPRQKNPHPAHKPRAAHPAVAGASVRFVHRSQLQHGLVMSPNPNQPLQSNVHLGLRSGHHVPAYPSAAQS